jgi:hypothetical protein
MPTAMARPKMCRVESAKPALFQGDLSDETIGVLWDCPSIVIFRDYLWQGGKFIVTVRFAFGFAPKGVSRGDG